jgi:putative ribosome biogenesis GTPase RsgA
MFVKVWGGKNLRQCSDNTLEIMQTCRNCKHQGTQRCPVRQRTFFVFETSQLLSKGFCDRWQQMTSG